MIGRECSHLSCGIRCQVRGGKVRFSSHVCGSVCLARGCNWTPFEFEPAVPAVPVPQPALCACGKPGAWRGDPDKGAQTCRCTECCAEIAVKAAIVRSQPPAFITKMLKDIEDASGAIQLAMTATGVYADANIRNMLQSLLGQAEDRLAWATRKIKETI